MVGSSRPYYKLPFFFVTSSKDYNVSIMDMLTPYRQVLNYCQ